MRAHTAQEIVGLAKKHGLRLVTYDQEPDNASIFGWTDEQGRHCVCAAGCLAFAEDGSARKMQLREARDGDWFLLGLEAGFENQEDSTIHSTHKDEPNYTNGFEVGAELRRLVMKGH